ncbi:MAG TPA: lipoyl(octanoyl) transferase LipB [Dehalococcoidia bacterium]|jgi:lipoate-protein ligase B|nr:lipoyl(octanoyl) transferase LipB [Dehalococcoidia bacterium]
MAATVRLLQPGPVDYSAVLRWQRNTHALVCSGGDETVALLQHPPVYTLGRRGGLQHVLRSAEELAAQGAEIVESDRGGDVTFHGPGQLVVYPILDLRARGIAAVDYVRALEAVAIDALRDCGLRGDRIEGRPGVWCGDAKVAAVGVRVKGGVSTHGMALNVSTDLSWFDSIVACGIADASVASMESLLGVAPMMATVESSIVDRLRAELGLTLRLDRCEQELRCAG